MDILNHVKNLTEKACGGHESIDVKYINVDELNVSIDALPDVLSTDEKEKVASLVKTMDKKRYQVTRVTLRFLLSNYLNIEPGNIVFNYSKNGKPKVFGSNGEEVYFNLTHSRNISVFAFSRKYEIGVDLEHVDDTRDNSLIIKNFFSKNEQSHLLSLDRKKRVNHFFRFWVIKEAYLKGSDLNLDELRKIEIEYKEVTIYLKDTVTGKHMSDWSFLIFEPVSCYIACLAFKPVSV